MLQVRETSKYFFDEPVLDCVSADFPSGISGIAGHNGSGKTVFLKMLAGVNPADSGSILLNGERLRLLSPVMSIRAGIAYVSQLGSISPSMSNEEFRTLTHGAVDLPAGQVLSELSLTDRQHIEFRLALAHQPKVLLLDEPVFLAGPDAEPFWAELSRYVEASGCIVLAVLHELEQLARRCQRVFLVRDHKITQWPEPGPEIGLAAKVDSLRRELGFLQNLQPALPYTNQTAGSVIRLRGREFQLDQPGLRCIFAKDSVSWPQIVGEFKDAMERVFSPGKVAWMPGHLPDRSLALGCTLRQNLALTDGHPWRGDTHGEIMAYLDSFQIAPREPEELAGNLSGGNRQRLALARAFALHRPVLALVNPLRGLDQSGLILVLDKIRQFVREGGTAVVLTDDQGAAEAFGGPTGDPL